MAILPKYTTDSKRKKPEISFNKEDFEFLLKTLQSANIRLKDLEQAVITIGKLQETYKSIIEAQK